MLHVLVETNLVVGWCAPGHHRDEAAVSLVRRAAGGSVRLHVPAISFMEARKVLQSDRFKTAEAEAFARFLQAAGALVPDADRAAALRVIDQFEAHLSEERRAAPARLDELRAHRGVQVFALDQSMLQRSIDLAMRLQLNPFDNAILGAVLVRADELAAEERVFCTLDRDLQPWSRNGDPTLLKPVYDAARLPVYGDFGLVGLAHTGV